MFMVIMDMNIMMIMIISIMATRKWGRDGHNDHDDDKNGNVYHGDDKMGARWSPCLEM